MFAVPFIVQMINIWNSSRYPNYPSVKELKKNLQDIEFPVSFKLCVRELNTTHRYSRYGYSDEHNFFRGLSKYNRSLRGWNGFSKNNSMNASVIGIQTD